MNIELNGHLAVLDPERCLWWPKISTLFLSDVHLGKASHFRKAGIYISGKTGVKDLDRISYLLKKYQPKRIVFLGDLFHSEYNAEWESFIDLRKYYADVEFILVEGNHDIMDKGFYDRAHVKVLEEGYAEEDVAWRHHPSQHPTTFELCGHLHPGVKLKGKARQTLVLPCFTKEPMRLVFPAFGRLTGKVPYEGATGTIYYPIAGTEILEISKPN